MQFNWYSLDWHGLVNPLVLFAAVFVLGALWNWRILSNRGYICAQYVLGLLYIVHVDYVLVVQGLDKGRLPPVEGWAPQIVRWIVYAVGYAFLVWGGWGWTKLRTTPSKLHQSRGLQYLRDRRGLK